MKTNPAGEADQEHTHMCQSQYQNTNINPNFHMCVRFLVKIMCKGHFAIFVPTFLS